MKFLILYRPQMQATLVNRWCTRAAASEIKFNTEQKRHIASVIGLTGS